jgi:hypothetical protein
MPYIILKNACYILASYFMDHNSYDHPRKKNILAAMEFHKLVTRRPFNAGDWNKGL